MTVIGVLVLHLHLLHLLLQSVMSKCFLLALKLPGRPLLEVSIEEIEYFRAMRFSWTKIATYMKKVNSI